MVARRSAACVLTVPSSLIQRLRGATRVVVFTGAGVSAESGVPTFRDPQTGLWSRFDPMELATPTAFARDPDLVWGWYEWRRSMVAQAAPNEAHRAIAAMAAVVPQLTLITQNVDDLHERAGSRPVLHLHGRIARPYCASCLEPYALPQSGPHAPDTTRIRPPRCGACGGQVRPGVVWFGEALPDSEWRAAVAAAGACDAFFCVGTSSAVQPAASLTGMAIRGGAVTVLVNPNPTEIDDDVSYALRGKAGTVLPSLVSQVWCPEPG